MRPKFDRVMVSYCYTTLQKRKCLFLSISWINTENIYILTDYKVKPICHYVSRFYLLLDINYESLRLYNSTKLEFSRKKMFPSLTKLKKSSCSVSISFIHNHPPGARLEGAKPSPRDNYCVQNSPLRTEQGVKNPTPGHKV